MAEHGREALRVVVVVAGADGRGAIRGGRRGAPDGRVLGVGLRQAARAGLLLLGVLLGVLLGPLLLLLLVLQQHHVVGVLLLHVVVLLLHVLMVGPAQLIVRREHHLAHRASPRLRLRRRRRSHRERLPSGPHCCRAVRGAPPGPAPLPDVAPVPPHAAEEEEVGFAELADAVCADSRGEAEGLRIPSGLGEVHEAAAGGRERL